MKTLKVSEIKEQIIESVTKIAKALEEGGETEALIGELLDLGIYQDAVEKSDDEFSHVLVTEGIHTSFLEKEGEEGVFGSMMKIRKAVQEKSGENFSEAVKGLTSLLNPTVPSEGDEPEEGGGEEPEEKPEEVVATEKDGGVEKSEKTVWPADMAKAYKAKQKALREKANFEDEKSKVQKFAKVQKEEFSWDSLVDGQIKA